MGRPTTINVGGSVKQLALGMYHSCALLNGGDIKCWGANDYGQLGDGTQSRRLRPTTINVGGRVKQLAVGGDHSCAWLDSGDIKCWGNNSNGQLGIGTTNSQRNAALVHTLSF